MSSVPSNGKLPSAARRRRRLSPNLPTWMAASALLALAPVAARAGCTISAGMLSFGTYTGAALNTGVGTVSVTCTSGTAWNIGINSGSHAGSGNYAWQMSDGGADTLPYSMYRDAARTSLWGGTPGYDAISGIGTGLAQTVIFYAAIPADSAVVPGSYADTITTILYSSFGTTTSSISVSAMVPSSCTLSAGALAFGVYAGAQTDSTATISATCTNTTFYSIGLGQGLHLTCCFNANMAGPAGAMLPYYIYSDASRSTLWGNSWGIDEVTGTGTGSAQSLTAYGRIPAGQVVTPGAYTDIVTATINY